MSGRQPTDDTGAVSLLFMTMLPGYGTADRSFFWSKQGVSLTEVLNQISAAAQAAAIAAADDAAPLAAAGVVELLITYKTEAADSAALVFGIQEAVAADRVLTQGSEQSAATSATNAAGSAQTAVTSAGTAGTAAAAAGGSATAAGTAQTGAETAAGASTGSAANAATSATTATTQAGIATTQANAAAGSATAADTSEANAAASATTAANVLDSKAPAALTNLVTNPGPASVTNWLSNTPAKWAVSYAANEVSIERLVGATGFQLVSNYCCGIQQVTLPLGTLWQFSVEVKPPVNATTIANGLIPAGIACPAGVWTRVTGNGVGTGVATFPTAIQLTADADPGAGAVYTYLRKAMLVQAPPTPVVPYFDGDSPNCRWTGTPGASTSIGPGVPGSVVDLSSPQTLANKRITPRTVLTASAAALTPPGDTADIYSVTALAVNATINAPTGTPTDGQRLRIQIKDNGSRWNLLWNAIYDGPLPYRTTGVTQAVEFVYNSITARWEKVEKSLAIESYPTGGSPTPNSGTDLYLLTALAVAATFGAPIGVPTEGQLLRMRVKDNGTARALTWNAAYRSGGAALPTTTIAGKQMHFLFAYNATDAVWALLSLDVQDYQTVTVDPALALPASIQRAIEANAERKIAVFRPNLAVPGLYEPNPDIWYPSLPLPVATHSVRVTDPLWTKPADNAPVASIRNGGSVGGDLVQAVAASRPLYKAADPLLNRMPSLAFDGVDDSIGVDFADMAIPVWLVAIAVTTTAVSTLSHQIIGTSTSNRGLSFSGTPVANKINLRFSVANSLTVATVPVNSPALIIGKSTAIESTVFLNGTVETFPPIDSFPGMMTLGMNAPTSNPLNGSIAYAAIFTQDPQLDPNWPNLLTLARACGVKV